MQKILRRLLTIAFVYAVVPFAAAQHTSSTAAQTSDRYAVKLQAFEPWVLGQMGKDKVTGMVIGFMMDGEVWIKGFGYSDVENQTLMKAESAFRLASVTKPMTAMAVLQLVEKGKIDLDAEVQTYVPYFPKKQWPVTVRQLLGHLGGVSHYKDYSVEGTIKVHKNTREALAIFENFDLVAEPGTKYSYTTYGYNLLGAAIEGASGQSYGDYMREHLWAPLGMESTRMDNPVDLIPHRVRGYRLINNEIKNSEFVDISSRFAGGGTRSTVGDLLKFAQGVIGNKALTKETTSLMFTPMQTRDGRLTGYGMGWEIGSLNGRFIVSHTGSQQETGTVLYVFPGRNLALAAAMNFEDATPVPYVLRLYDLLTDERWHTATYAAGKEASAIYSAMKEVFENGLAYFESHQRPLSDDPAELAAALAYFNQCVDRNALRSGFDKAMRQIDEGQHPSPAGLPFVKLGSYMAAKNLTRFGVERAKTYCNQGAFSFFGDYVETYKQGENHGSLRFSPAFEKMLAKWRSDWQRTNTAFVRELQLSSEWEVAAVDQQLKTLFAGAEVYPDLIDALTTTTRSLAGKGELEKARHAAEASVQLYPQSDRTQVTLAVVHLIGGDKKQARALVQKAANFDNGDATSAGDLNSLAYDLMRAGQLDAGLALLEIAVALHPEVANLYDSLGEFHLNKGEKQEAIRYYKKALEVDPNFANAQRMLKQIEETVSVEKR